MLKNKESNNIQLNTAAASLKEGRKGVALQDNRVDSSKAQIKIIQRQVNKTGMPDALKNGIEHHSGISMDDVKVHYNSDKPSQLQAHAYAQGTDIHIAPGQEKHLPHEAWHVVQQKQGRVKPTRQIKGKVAINDDKGLEKEADIMGAKSMAKGKNPKTSGTSVVKQMKNGAVQLAGNTMYHANVADPNSFQDAVLKANGNTPKRDATTNKTDIYGTGNNVIYSVNEGSTMKAFPISNWSNGGGSETSDGVRLVSRAATELYGKSYIAGHLLNNHLGGPGNQQENITAFTSKSNSQHHAGIEKELKQDVNNGFIAYYQVNCSDRAGYIPGGNNPHGLKGISGLAKSMQASYSLLRVKGNPDYLPDYQPARYLSLNLDPGGTNQTAQRDGQGIHDAEVVYEQMIKLFQNPASNGQFEKLLKYAADQNMDVFSAYHYVINNCNQSFDKFDQQVVKDNLERLMRE